MYNIWCTCWWTFNARLLESCFLQILNEKDARRDRRTSRLWRIMSDGWWRDGCRRTEDSEREDVLPRFTSGAILDQPSHHCNDLAALKENRILDLNPSLFYTFLVLCPRSGLHNNFNALLSLLVFLSQELIIDYRMSHKSSSVPDCMFWILDPVVQCGIHHIVDCWRHQISSVKIWTTLCWI